MTTEDNELICRVGPGTPMNAMMRKYWLPVCLSGDVAEKDSHPFRVQLLGEWYVAFRDSEGRAALLDEACPHRGTSLALGRVEDCGIRCIFHGWKFGADGCLQEVPNLESSETFRAKVRVASYPTREAGGLVWAFLGSPEDVPTFPSYNYMNLPEQSLATFGIRVECNWLQILEGGIDSSHLGLLHDDFHPLALPAPGESSDESTPVGVLAIDAGLEFEDHSPKLEVQLTDFGFQYAAIREMTGGGTSGFTADDAPTYIRVTAFAMPCMVIVGSVAIYYVPRNDYSTNWIFVVPSLDPTKEVDREVVMRNYGLVEPWYKDGVLSVAEEDRWGQDRSLMGTSFSGIPGLLREDGAVAVAMGPIADRTKEHLVPADVAIIRARRLLLEGVRAVARGEEPPGRAPSDFSAIRSTEGILDRGASWQEFVQHAQSL